MFKSKFLPFWGVIVPLIVVLIFLLAGFYKGSSDINCYPLTQDKYESGCQGPIAP